MMNYTQARQYLEGVIRTGIKYDLVNIRRLLALLGHPERLFPIVCVAGTNGKGSVCAFLESILTEAGYRVGLNTSPHLVTPRERIRIDRRMVSREEFAAAISEVRSAAERGWRLDDPGRPTFFETMTSAALCHMRTAGVDIALLEAGLGGRLDATNATQPVLTVITRIAVDHPKTLGDTLHKIAFEKAGLIRAGKPMLIGRQKAAAARRLEALAAFRGALPIRVGSRWWESGGKLSLRTPRGRYHGIELALPGNYQRENAACAVRAAEVLRSQGLRIDAEAVRDGLARAHWPARLQTSSVEGRAVLIDSSHNPDGIGRFLSELERIPAKRRVLIYGTMADKSVARIAARLFPRFGRIMLPGLPFGRAAEPQALAARAASMGIKADLFADVAAAWHAAKQAAGEGDLVVVTGSIYLAGEFMKAVGLPSGE